MSAVPDSSDQSSQTAAIPDLNNAASVRRMHLNHEANIKAVGMLYYLGVIIGVVVVILSLTGTIKLDKGILTTSSIAFTLGLCIFNAWVGRGLRTLNPVVKIPAGVQAGIGLLGFPVGTLISGFVLYLLFSKKGTMVFSDEYKQVIAATPDIKYRTSIIIWFFLALLVLVILLGVAAALVHH